MGWVGASFGPGDLTSVLRASDLSCRPSHSGLSSMLSVQAKTKTTFAMLFGTSPHVCCTEFVISPTRSVLGGLPRCKSDATQTRALQPQRRFLWLTVARQVWSVQGCKGFSSVFACVNAVRLF